MTEGCPQPGLLPPGPDSRRKRGPSFPISQPASQSEAKGAGSFPLECLWLGSGEEDAFSGPAPNQRCRGYGAFSTVALVEGRLFFRRLAPAGPRPALEQDAQRILSLTQEATSCYFSILGG